MALLGFEGFDNLANNNPRNIGPDLEFMPFGGGSPSAGVWNATGNSSSLMIKIPGLLGGSALQCGGTVFGALFECRLATHYATLITGFRWLANSANFVDAPIMQFLDGASVQCGLNVNNVGRLYFWRGTTANILATGTQTIVQTSWYMIEVQVTINNATGAVDVYVDGAIEMSVSGVDTQNTANPWTTAVQFVFNAPTTVGVSAIDDFYICDTTGPAPYNAPLGVIRVETTFVGANVSVAWTPLSGTNFQMVDETSQDGDSTYNSCVAAATDTFTHSGLVNTPITNFAVDVIACVRKNDVTNQSYRTKLISGATTANGHTMNPATVYQYVKDTYLLDPNTGAAWTAAAINATNVGYERL